MWIIFGDVHQFIGYCLIPLDSCVYLSHFLILYHLLLMISLLLIILILINLWIVLLLLKLQKKIFNLYKLNITMRIYTWLIFFIVATPLALRRRHGRSRKLLKNYLKIFIWKVDLILNSNFRDLELKTKLTLLLYIIGYPRLFTYSGDIIVILAAMPLEKIFGGVLFLFRDNFSWKGGGTLPQNSKNLFRTYKKLLCKLEPYRFIG